MSLCVLYQALTFMYTPWGWGIREMQLKKLVEGGFEHTGRNAKKDEDKVRKEGDEEAGFDDEDNRVQFMKIAQSLTYYQHVFFTMLASNLDPSANLQLLRTIEKELTVIE